MINLAQKHLVFVNFNNAPFYVFIIHRVMN